MPLIVLTGFPCSGKSTRANELKTYFDEICNTKLLTDEHFRPNLDKNDCFSNSAYEKDLRSFLKSEVTLHISADTVILDSNANYIKGYRYELYCLSKMSKTTLCVVHCDLLPEDCMSFDLLRPKSLQYQKDVFDSLVQRFEAPNDSDRWDSPLFTVHKDEKLPFTEIQNALFLCKPPPPNLSTQTQPMTSPNFLFNVDKVTQDMMKVIINAQRSHTSDYISVPPAEEQICIPTSFPVAELIRMRRQFISYVKRHPNVDTDRIPDLFVQYLAQRI